MSVTTAESIPKLDEGHITRSDEGVNTRSDEGHITERYLLISWCSVVLFGCLIGNTIILLATVRCKTIRLDQTSLVLIKNIAVSDILMGIFGVHPVLASLIHGACPYGSIPCYIFHYLQVPVYLSAVLLICGLHLNKLYTVVYPLSTVGRSSRAGHVISATAWLLCTLFPATQIIVDFKPVMYAVKTYRCMYSYQDAVWNWLLPLIGAVSTAFPNILVGGTTAALVFLVRRAKRRYNKQGILVALYVGCFYLLANIPASIDLLIFKSFRQFMSPEVYFFFDFYFYRASYFMVFMNCSCNFLVYYCSIKSFNVFVNREFRSLFREHSSRSGREIIILRTLDTIRRS